MSAESGMETPTIFTDPAYARSVTHDLSTSQVMQCVISTLCSDRSLTLCLGLALDSSPFPPLLLLRDKLSLLKAYCKRTCISLIFSSQVLFHLTLSFFSTKVPASLEVYFCFGPTAEGGYGIGYNPQENCIFFSTTSFNSASETGSLSLGCTITEAFLEIMDLLQQLAC